MQRSSDTIAQLACALSKAQIELVNPEKTMEATIYKDGGGQEGRTFKYASLASGLDIVRKTLGHHEIATVQTTAIDTPSQIVTLTTVLAHSSGEWIASDWPVCGVAETATPRRMGEALTYARRYALFTLVGIAGEDDLDAPDLVNPTPGSGLERREPSGNGRLNGNGSSTEHSNGKTKIMPRPVLEPGASAELRDRLVTQISGIGSAEDAALWAYCNMRAKNGLGAADARQVEKAFEGKLSGLRGPTESLPLDGHGSERDVSGAVHTAGEPAGDASAASPAGVPSVELSQPTAPAPKATRRRAKRTKAIDAVDKTVLTFPEPRRVRDREHVRFVAKQTCLVCGRQPSDAHHLRFAQGRALGRKVSDEFTVPLCRGHHREIHRCGDEAQWWGKLGIDPTVAARALWLETHPLSSAAKGLAPAALASPHRADAPSDHAIGKLK